MTSALTTTALDQLSNAQRDAADRALAAAERLKTGKEFEAMFLRQTLESILPDSKNTLFGGGTAGSMWRSMLADRVSGVLAERGVLGLSDMLASSKDGK